MANATIIINNMGTTNLSSGKIETLIYNEETSGNLLFNSSSNILLDMLVNGQVYWIDYLVNNSNINLNYQNETIINGSYSQLIGSNLTKGIHGRMPFTLPVSNNFTGTITADIFKGSGHLLTNIDCDIINFSGVIGSASICDGLDATGSGGSGFNETFNTINHTSTKIGVNTSAIQRRVLGNCSSSDQSIKNIYENGSVDCEIDDSGDTDTWNTTSEMRTAVNETYLFPNNLNNLGYYYTDGSIVFKSNGTNTYNVIRFVAGTNAGTVAVYTSDNQTDPENSASSMWTIQSSKSLHQNLMASSDWVGNSLIFGDWDYRSSDYDHALQANPTLFIHSSTNPDSDNTQFIGVTHNKTESWFYSGKGDLVLKNNTRINGSITTNIGSCVQALETDSTGKIVCGTDVDTYNTTLQMRKAVNNSILNASNFYNYSWTRLSNIPSGFKDGIDNTSSGASYDLNISGVIGTGTITDSEVLTVTANNGVTTSMSGNTLTFSLTNYTYKIYIKNNNQTSTSNTVLSNITGLNFTLASNSIYEFNCQLIFNTQITTTGLVLALWGSATPTWSAYEIYISQSSTTYQNRAFYNLLNTAVVATGVTSNTTQYSAYIIGKIKTQGSMISLCPQMRSEISGSYVRVYQGSSCKYTKIS